MQLLQLGVGPPVRLSPPQMCSALTVEMYSQLLAGMMGEVAQLLPAACSSPAGQAAELVAVRPHSLQTPYDRHVPLQEATGLHALQMPGCSSTMPGSTAYSASMAALRRIQEPHVGPLRRRSSAASVLWPCR